MDFLEALLFRPIKEVRPTIQSTYQNNGTNKFLITLGGGGIIV